MKKIGKIKKVGFEQKLKEVQSELENINKEIWVLTQRQNRINIFVASLLEKERLK